MLHTWYRKQQFYVEFFLNIEDGNTFNFEQQVGCLQEFCES